MPSEQFPQDQEPYEEQPTPDVVPPEGSDNLPATDTPQEGPQPDPDEIDTHVPEQDSPDDTTAPGQPEGAPEVYDPVAFKHRHHVGRMALLGSKIRAVKDKVTGAASDRMEYEFPGFQARQQRRAERAEEHRRLHPGGKSFKDRHPKAEGDLRHTLFQQAVATREGSNTPLALHATVQLLESYGNPLEPGTLSDRAEAKQALQAIIDAPNTHSVRLAGSRAQEADTTRDWSFAVTPANVQALRLKIMELASDPNVIGSNNPYNIDQARAAAGRAIARSGIRGVHTNLIPQFLGITHEQWVQQHNGQSYTVPPAVLDKLNFMIQLDAQTYDGKSGRSVLNLLMEGGDSPTEQGAETMRHTQQTGADFINERLAQYEQTVAAGEHPPIQRVAADRKRGVNPTAQLLFDMGYIDNETLRKVVSQGEVNGQGDENDPNNNSAQDKKGRKGERQDAQVADEAAERRHKEQLEAQERTAALLEQLLRQQQQAGGQAGSTSGQGDDPSGSPAQNNQARTTITEEDHPADDPEAATTWHEGEVVDGQFTEETDEPEPILALPAPQEAEVTEPASDEASTQTEPAIADQADTTEDRYAPYFASERLRELDAMVAEAIRSEVRAIKSERGTDDQLSRKEFGEIKRRTRTAILRREVGEDAPDSVIADLTRAMRDSASGTRAPAL